MSEVKPIPEGTHSITPHLVCRGAAEAIEFYKKAFGAEEIGRHQTPDGRIMHASIRVGDSNLSLVDEFPEMNCLGPASLNGTPVTLHLYVTNVDTVFQRALDAGAKVTMPVQDMFWGDRYGRLKDPFGHDWSIATRVREVSPEEAEEAGKKFFSK